eukprot:1200187-Amorphochlora_amoeboformis.AAC.1
MATLRHQQGVVPLLAHLSRMVNHTRLAVGGGYGCRRIFVRRLHRDSPLLGHSQLLLSLLGGVLCLGGFSMGLAAKLGNTAALVDGWTNPSSRLSYDGWLR